MKLPIKNYNNIIKKKKKLLDYSKILILRISTDCYISRFTAHFKTESVELFFGSSLIRKVQAVIAL